MKKITQSNIAVCSVGWLLIGVHFIIFSQFFPNAQGKLGHDYSYNLPLLLDGYYWFLNNGFLSLPWFTPSFCGGMPLMANPATFYVSAAQFFTFFIDPVSAIRLTFFLFATLGFWGFYQLLSRQFNTSPWTALLGGGIFLFNGLYAYRFIVGHMEFHSFMLVPWLTLFLIHNGPGARRLVSWDHLGSVIFSALILAYMFMSGMAQLIVPSLIGVLVIILVKKMLESSFSLVRSVATLTLAGLISLCLCASKLVAALSFLGHFPRESYLLPGVDGVFQLLILIVQVLTLGGAGVDFTETVVNWQWLLGQHEFEFGLSLTPFLLIAAAVFLNRKKLRSMIGTIMDRKTFPYFAALLIFLCIPLLLNFYSPAWNHFLKTIPMVKNLSNFFRWFIIYIPVVVLFAALAVEKTETLHRLAMPVALLGLLLTVGQNIFYDNGFYHEQNYDPAVIVTAYEAAQSSGSGPPITDLVVSYDQEGRAQMGSNDVLADGHSQLLCYEPMFGFRLEFLPFKTIHPGPISSLEDGVYNLKNPACYLYPLENNCAPGDHFLVSQQHEAQRFSARQPFRYEVSVMQKTADRINLISLVLILLAAATWCISFFVITRRDDKGPGRRAGGTK